MTPREPSEIADIRGCGELGGTKMTDGDDGCKNKGPLGELSKEDRKRQAQDDWDFCLVK